MTICVFFNDKLQSVLGYLHATRLSFPEFTAAYTCIRITWCVILIVLCVRTHWFQLCLNRFNEYIQTSYLKNLHLFTKAESFSFKRLKSSSSLYINNCCTCIRTRKNSLWDSPSNLVGLTSIHSAFWASIVNKTNMF